MWQRGHEKVTKEPTDLYRFRNYPSPTTVTMQLLKPLTLAATVPVVALLETALEERTTACTAASSSILAAAAAAFPSAHIALDVLTRFSPDVARHAVKVNYNGKGVKLGPHVLCVPTPDLHYLPADRPLFRVTK